MDGIRIPDLRFEQGFMSKLEIQALKQQANKKISKRESKVTNDPTSCSDIQIDEKTSSGPLSDSDLSNIPIITPGIVTYTVLKDQILMPFLQGLFWAGFLILSRPLYMKIIQSGLYWGNVLARRLRFFSTSNIHGSVRAYV